MKLLNRSIFYTLISWLVFACAQELPEDFEAVSAVINTKEGSYSYRFQQDGILRKTTITEDINRVNKKQWDQEFINNDFWVPNPFESVELGSYDWTQSNWEHVKEVLMEDGWYLTTYKKEKEKEVNPLAPNILSVSPLEAEPGDVVTITGERLSNASVLLNGRVQKLVEGTNTDTEVKFVIEFEAESGFLSVNTKNGLGEFENIFKINPIVPIFEKLKMVGGFEVDYWAERGKQIEIIGEVLASTTEVKIGNKSANIANIQGDTLLLVDIPGDAVSGLIEIINPKASIKTTKVLDIVNVYPITWCDGIGEASKTGPLFVTQTERVVAKSNNDFLIDADNSPVIGYDDNSNGYFTSFGQAFFGAAGMPEEYWAQFKNKSNVKIRIRAAGVGEETVINSFIRSNDEARTKYISDRLTLEDGVWKDYTWSYELLSAGGAFIPDFNNRAIGWQTSGGDNPQCLVDYIIITESVD